MRFTITENIKKQIEATAENNYQQLTLHLDFQELCFPNLSFQYFVHKSMLTFLDLKNASLYLAILFILGS